MPPKHITKAMKKRLAAERKAAEQAAAEMADSAVAAGTAAPADSDAAAAAAGDAASGAEAGDAPVEKSMDLPAAAGSSSAASGAGTSSAKGAETDVAAVAMALAAEAAASATELEEEMVGELQHRHLMDEAIAKLSITFATSAKSVHENSRDIKVEGLNINLGKKELVKDATLSLNWGNRYGLVGANGCGKSLLMTAIGRRLVPIPKSLDIYHVVSEVEASDMKALEAVLAVDTEKKALEAEAEALSHAMEHMTETDEAATEIMSERVADIYDRLDMLEAATAEARAASILHGLGFTVDMQSKRCRDFSGGWRMRISLARALFLDSSILLLDEPTNHLDMEAVVWLERYLAKREKILLLVSHSQDFLNAVTTHTLHFNEGQLTTYTGNYDSYVQTRREREGQQMKRYQWEQDQIKAMKQYIAKFGHGSAKLAKQAQSKEKTLAKMEEKGLTKVVAKERSFTMRWPDPGALPPPVLQVLNVSFHYPGGPYLYKSVDFGLDLDSRVALVGPNGAGKTTLLKLIAHELTPTEGQVKPHAHLRMARYTQHFVDTLDLEKTPFDYFGTLGRLKDANEQQLRSYLGRFGVSGEYQTTEMKYLSDGLKSRVVFAQMAVMEPHILMLDEPTNHLDIETIDCLADAINDFVGGVILVSHDMRLISQVAKEIWECDKGTITRFVGEISDYKAFLALRVAEAERRFERIRNGEAVEDVSEVSANEFATKRMAARGDAEGAAAAAAMTASASASASATSSSPKAAAAGTAAKPLRAKGKAVAAATATPGGVYRPPGAVAARSGDGGGDWWRE